MWIAWWAFSDFKLSIKPGECVSACRRADIRTCVGHSDFTSLLFPSPVVSAWFIQGQTQSETITLAWKDLAVLLEEVKGESRGGGKKMNNVRWGVEDTKQYQGSSGHAPKRLPLTYAGLISAFLAASVILFRHLQLRHIRKGWGDDTGNETALTQMGEAALTEAISQQRGSLRPLSPFGNNQGLLFFCVCFLVKLEGGWLNAHG